MNNSDNSTRSNPQFNQQVKDLFTQCVEVSHEQQKEIITTSEYSEKVKEMVESLLVFQDDTKSHLTGAIKKSIDINLGDETLKAGDSIDNFQLVKPLGAGGQGEVWLAERNDGEFTHKVAIKFIKLSHTESELFRFKTERELLASLRHANIAQLIGGGTYQDHRLYMILEWVDGLSIIDYARKNLFSIKDYLLCFEQVCQAVSFAHNNGVIHRDIKPSNIIVTKDGTVKLLDFGIAKNIDAESTQTKSEMMMTFAYSSPEQIKGQPVSTATDVYALGLILYELLTCKKAQDCTTESHADMVHNITEITPDFPSKIEPETTLDFTPKKLQGDLDNLIMMAIRKEPQRRYATVKDIISDIENYLESRPLSASGDSVGYKFNKLIKRNPMASAFASIVLAFLVALPLYMYKTNREIKSQRDLAHETSDFLMDILKSASPLGVNGKETKLSDVLEQGERQIEFNFQDQLPLKANMYDTLGLIQHNIGNNPKAIEYFKKAEDIYVVLNDKVGQLRSLGQQAIYATMLGEVEKANNLLLKADIVAQSVSDVKAVAMHQIRKATLMHQGGEYEQSSALLMETLQLLKSENISDDKMFGRLYFELAISLKFKDKRLGLEYNQKALDLAKSSLGYNHPIYQSRLVSRAIQLMNVYEYDKAKQVLDESLMLTERLYSNTNQRYAAVLEIKSLLHHDLGEFKQAQSNYKQSIEIFKNTYGKESAKYVFGINNLAYLYEDMGKYHLAEPLYRQSIALRKKLDPNNIMQITSAEANLARLLVKLGKYQEAKNGMPNIIKQYKLHNRNNLYNSLINAAIVIKEGNDVEQCKKGVKQIDELIPDLEKQSAKGWRRMYAELWIGQMLMNCGIPARATVFLDAALKKSKTIYKKDSIGQQLMAQRVDDTLSMSKVP